MLPLSTLLQHSLFYGALLSAAMTAFILTTLYWRPMMWIGDAPAEVQAAAPPPSAADRRIKRVAGGLVFVVLLAILAVSLAALRRLAGGALSFADVAVSTFLIFMTFNLVDLLLIDWLVVETLRPGFITFPGVAGANLNLTGGYAYHFRAFLKGTMYGMVVSLVVAAVVVLVL